MSYNAEWDKAVPYEKFLETARENVELMKARFNDLMVSDEESELIQSIQNDIHILVIGTDRCNDTAGNFPVLARIASIGPKVHLRILDSDTNAQFHRLFKVNGKRKTPVVLFLNAEFAELCRWVERPNAAYQMINEKNNLSLEDRRAQLRQLYSDPEILRQSLGEFLHLLLRADLILGRH
ncbi:MAG: thioredoxin family protein [Candidatus Thorarchaeota archaeon]